VLCIGRRPTIRSIQPLRCRFDCLRYLHKTLELDKKQHCTTDTKLSINVPTGATLKVTKGSEDGEVIDTKVIDSTDDIVKYEYQFDKKILCADKETEILYFTVVADEEEIYTSDNTRTLVLSVNNDSTDKTTVSGYISVDFDYPPESESK